MKKKEEEIILRMVQHNLWAACLQETWRIGDNTWENDGFTFIQHGFSVKLCKRGALGVAIVLSSESRKAWERAGSKNLYFAQESELPAYVYTARRVGAHLPCSS